MTERRVAIYMRFAKVDDIATHAQEAVLKEYTAQHPGWRLEAQYYDLGVSSDTAQRPALCQLLQAIREGRLDSIIVKSPSRFYRDAIKTAQIISDIQASGAEVVFTNGSRPENILRSAAMMEVLSGGT